MKQKSKHRKHRGVYSNRKKERTKLEEKRGYKETISHKVRRGDDTP